MVLDTGLYQGTKCKKCGYKKEGGVGGWLEICDAWNATGQDLRKNSPKKVDAHGARVTRS